MGEVIKFKPLINKDRPYKDTIKNIIDSLKKIDKLMKELRNAKSNDNNVIAINK